MDFGGNGGNGGSQGHRGGLLPCEGTQVPDINVPGEAHQSSNNTTNENFIREPACLMPIANVARIMRRILPDHAKISDESKVTMQECASEFISFITSEASVRCQAEGRRILTAEDLIWAMRSLEFDNYVNPLLMYLHRYRENENSMFVTERNESSTSAPAFIGQSHHPPGVLPGPGPRPSFVCHHTPGFFPGPRPISYPSGSGESSSQIEEAEFNQSSQTKE